MLSLGLASCVRYVDEGAMIVSMIVWQGGDVGR